MKQAESSPSRPRLVAVALGAAVTLLIALTCAMGRWERLELLALDERLALVATDPDDDPIVHVNIDDRSLQEIGRWPWPRKVIADIVTALDAAGAKIIALDVIFPEPQEVRLVDPAAEVYAGDAGEWLQQGPPRRVYDDLLLADAIARADTVLVPMHLDFDTNAAPGPIERSVDEQFDPAKLPPSLAEVTAELFADPLAASPETVASARREYLRQRAIRSLTRFALDPSAVPPARLSGGRMTPPLVLLARASDGTGFVTVEPDSDRVVRRIRLLGRSGGRSWAQFALAVARRAKGDANAPAGLTLDDGAVRFGSDELDGELPVDVRQRMIIRWSPPGAQPVRISAAAVAAIGREQDKLRENSDAADVACWQLASMGKGFPNEKIKTLYWRCAELSEKLDAAHAERVTLQEQQLRRRLYQPGADAKAGELSAVRQREQQTQQRLRRSLRGLADQLRDETSRRAFILGDANSTVDGEQREALSRAEELLSLIDRLEAARRPLRESVRRLESRLADRVAGKIVLIGSTATGAADFVPTPRGPRTPGVEVHAEILRTVLGGWSVREAGLAWDLVAVVAAGLAVTAIASCCGALRAAALSAVLLGVLLAGNAWVLFAWAGVSLAVAAPVGAMGGSFLVVTAYRQLTEERARRRIRRMFSHAVSPKVADELMRNPSMASVGGERREISCLFSDLGGFTDLSQRIGSRATVSLLNRYFDEVTDVVQHEQGGYLNKFLGDGVLALFGAPLEQADHPARAIRAAVGCHARVGELNRESASPGNGPAAALRLRTGIASGEAMVGNCGSSERMDYTAIGDCVNLASRLETACKFFGAKLLVTDGAWKAAHIEDLPARSLGAVWITGVAERVEIWEVLVGDAPEPAALERFAEGVAHLGDGRYARAGEAFESVAETNPADGAAAVFAKLTRALADGEDPAGKAGNGTVRIAWPGSEGFASA